MGSWITGAALACALLVTVGALSVAAAPATGPHSAPDLSARAAIVIDDETGEVLYAQDAHVQMPPASLTKIVTAIVVLEHTYLNEPVHVRARWDELYDASVMGLVDGELLTVEELLYGLMLPSGNDAALALARHVAGSEAAFVAMMNRKMHALGLEGSHFSNSHGMDEPAHYTTAYDIATAARYALRNPVFATIVRTTQRTVRGRGVYPLRNTNRLLRTVDGVVGVKTGYTEEALMTLVVAAERQGRRVVIAVLGSQNSFLDAQRLLDYTFGDDTGSDGLLLASARAAGRRRPPGDVFGRPRMFGPWYTPTWPRWWVWDHSRRAFEVEYALLTRASPTTAGW